MKSNLEINNEVKILLKEKEELKTQIIDKFKNYSRIF